ncbi:alpha/beta superfamily hydrolase [Hirsutella rhossiliensis]|uniref:Alpha/beta superfamily hydrolase n=1 Tax=Hirsutella rhossiliensis TaxID=111463 RepID=A0A9P8MMJ4_9HYPO|nr:alpha/beta superfamily hydrolase [Hirsutella rhossiliensis]KAH0957895.1 alpha/beta superfamily hydrolase [Hirsutella rhossiliensis]
MPPLIFTGLFVTLWCWKCTMLVLFQNAIIYNPFIPPNARSMRISDFARHCGGIQWREERIRSLDGTSIALCINEMASLEANDPGGAKAKPPVYILYFQGNASSLPPRLPDISWVLRRLRDGDQHMDCTTICLSYRGYWTSHDRPSERGINMDAQAALQWISQRHRDRAAGNQLLKPVVVLWGQSIGCGFATNLAAMPRADSDLSIDAMILETPFTNTRAMLAALYPQRWLPYRHLWPFLRNHLDSWKNLGVIAGMQQVRPPQVCIVEAAKDELVPREHGAMLQRRCQDLGLIAERVTIRGALHNDVTGRTAGKQAIAQAIGTAVERASGLSAPPKATAK